MGAESVLGNQLMHYSSLQYVCHFRYCMRRPVIMAVEVLLQPGIRQGNATLLLVHNAVLMIINIVMQAGEYSGKYNKILFVNSLTE